MAKLIKNNDYNLWITTVKRQVYRTQIKASVSVNTALLSFYWELGSQIVDKEKDVHWGDGFLQQVAKDLSTEFSDIKGFSYRNIRSIKQWYLFWQQLVANLTQIPWGHNLVIISKCKDLEEAVYYVNNTRENGISRSVLIHQVETKLYQREDKAVTNFSETLTPIQSDLAREITKDPYNFDFLTLTKKYQEKELEQALTDNITNFLLELGAGFSFVGRQYSLKVAGKDFKIDLLFYHIKLRCYVVIELKTVDFKPEFAEKLNFYTSAIDGEIKGKDDNTTIGILICKSKNDLVVEYALKDMKKPIGVSEYELTNSLPKNLKSSLPSLEEIEQEIGGQ